MSTIGFYRHKTKINLYQSYGEVKVWRKKGFTHDSKNTESSVRKRGASVMAWACTATGKRSLLIMVATA